MRQLVFPRCVMSESKMEVMHFVWPSLGNYALFFHNMPMVYKPTLFNMGGVNKGIDMKRPELGTPSNWYNHLFVLQGLYCWVRSPAQR